MRHRAFDILGNIAIVNFQSHKNNKKITLKEKKKFAINLINKNKNIKTVLEKADKVKGRLRKPTTRFLAGVKTKDVLYHENNCVFRFNIDSTYFSPRLSNERKEISSKIKKGEEVLVMFAGVSPFSIVIARNSLAKKIYSNEINREANKYAKLNIDLNKLNDKVELVPGDIKRLVKNKKITKKFDVIVMPRPQLKNSFLSEAFKLCKKRTRIYYYDFCKLGEEEKIIEKIKTKSIECNKKIKINNYKKAGEIAPYKIRLRVDFEVI